MNGQPPEYVSLQSPWIEHPNGVPLEDAPKGQEFASWTELSTPKLKTVFVPEIGKSIQYVSFVPLDKLIEFQARCQIGTPRADRMGFMAEVLKFIMVNPVCRTVAEARAALKSSGPVILGIVNEVIAPKDFEQAEMTAEIAKASPDSRSSAES